jgi:hypothetical protein
MPIPNDVNYFLFQIFKNNVTISQVLKLTTNMLIQPIHIEVIILRSTYFG